VTGAGAAMAVLIAIAASPLTPIGPARWAEPSPGVAVNLAILAAGFAALALLPLALAARAAWRAARQAMGPLGVAEPPATASWLARTVPRVGLVTAGLGIRMAFEPGHGRTAVPVRSALAGTMVAITAVIAALVFGTSLVALVDSPHQYGQNWAVKVDLEQPTITLAQVRGVMSGLRGVTGYAAGNYGEVRLAGTLTPAIGVDAVSGTGFLTLLRGRQPTRPDEIALGSETMRGYGLRLGQRVPAAVIPEPAGQGRPVASARIVGEVVLPSFSEGGFAATDLGQGAEVTPAMLSSPYQPTGCTRTLTCYTFILIRYRSGTSLPAAEQRLQAALTANHCPPGCATITTNQQPAAIVDYTSVRGTPLVLSALLALLAIGALAHVLLTSVRRRARDLAMLRTLGLVRGQLLRVVFWQAAAMAMAALLVGVPAGLLAGRWAWMLFANSAGVRPAARIPGLVVLLVLPATLAVAVIIAARPGVQAARIRPAVTLRRD
jgi:putative ABC transport system permease protein